MEEETNVPKVTASQRQNQNVNSTVCCQKTYHHFPPFFPLDEYKMRRREEIRIPNLYLT